MNSNFEIRSKVHSNTRNKTASTLDSSDFEFNNLSVGSKSSAALGHNPLDQEKFIKDFQSLNLEGLSIAAKKIILESLLNFLKQRGLRCFELTETRRAILVPKLGNEHNLLIIRDFDDEKITYILIKRQHVLLKKDAKFLSEKLTNGTQNYERLKSKNHSPYKLIDDQNSNNYTRPFCTRLDSLKKELTELLKLNSNMKVKLAKCMASLTESTVESCVELVAQSFEAAARSTIVFLLDSKIQASQVHKYLMPETNLRTMDINQIHSFCKAGAGGLIYQQRIAWYCSFPNFISIVHSNLELTKAIDDNQSFKQAAAKYYNCEPALIGRLATGNFAEEYFLLTLLLLSEAPVSTVPNNNTKEGAKTWQAIATITRATKLLLWESRQNQGAFVDQLKNPNTLATKIIRNFSSRSKESFLAVGSALTPSLQIRSRINYGPYSSCIFEEIHDYVSLLTNTITLPLLLNYSPTLNMEENKETVKRLTLWYLSNFCNPLQIYKLSQQWHKTFGQQTYRTSQFMEWKGLCLPQILNNGCAAIPLTNNYELFQEGLSMHHCVASMTTDCCRYEKFIFSIRDRENKRMSTLTLKLDSNNLFYEFEHKSKQNSATSPEADNAASFLIENLNMGKIFRLLSNDEIRSRVNKAKLGFDFQDLAVWRDAFGKIISFLPKSQQRFSCPVELAKEVGLMELKEFKELVGS